MSSNWVEFLEKLISVTVGAIGTWLALRTFYQKRHEDELQRYADSNKREYAAQRDFEHIRRNQEQMKTALTQLDDEVNDLRGDMKELKGILTMMLGRSGESISTIFGNKRKDAE